MDGTDPIPRSSRTDRRVVTLLALRVRGGVGFPPSHVEPVSAVDSYEEALTKTIDRYGGLVFRSGQDVFWGAFGVGTAHEDDPERGVRAAWELLTAFDRISAERGFSVIVTTGICTGVVKIAGTDVGEHPGMPVEGVAVGRAENLRDDAAVGEIRVSGETVERSCRAFTFKRLELAGGSVSFPDPGVYTLVGPSEVAYSEPVTAHFVGRSIERKRLQHQVDSCRAGRPQCAVIRGEAGIGKSALLGALDLGGLQIWRCCCKSYDMQVPFSLVCDLLRTGDWEFGDRHSTENAELLAWLRQGGASIPRSSALEGLRIDQLAIRASELLVTLVLDRVEHHGQPVALVLEDMQWCDEASRTWLGDLIERFRSPHSKAWPFLLLFTCRDSDWFPDFEDTTFEVMSFTLKALNPSEAIEVATATLNIPTDRREWPSTIAPLVDRALYFAQGVPLFLIELLGHLVTTGALGPKNARGSSIAATMVSVESLPDSLMALVRTRLDSLSAEAAVALTAACVLGRIVSGDLVAELVGSPPAEIGLPELVAVGLLCPRGRGFAFTQELVREVVYDELPSTLRSGLHRRVAASLIRRAESGSLDERDAHQRLAAVAPLVACHELAAGAFSESLKFIWLAAQSAKQAAQPLIARKWLETCLDALDHAPDPPQAPAIWEIYLASAQLHTGAGDHAAAEGDLARALSAAPTRSSKSLVFLALAALSERRGEYQQAILDLGKALDLSRSDASIRAQALSNLALIRFRLGQFDACQSLLSQAERESPDNGDLLGFIYSLTGLLHYRKGAVQEAIRSHDLALDSRRGARDLSGVARSLNNLAVAKMDSGDQAGALADAKEALELARRVGDRVLTCMVLTNLGHWELGEGRADQAAGHLRIAIELKVRLRDAQGAAISRVTLGEALLAQGDKASGMRSLRQGVADLEALEAREVLPEAYLALAKACAQTDNVSEAIGLLETAKLVATEAGAAARIREIEIWIDKLKHS